MFYALFALIGIVVVARFLFTLLFPVLSMRIRLAFIVRSFAKLAEQQADRVERATNARTWSRR